MITDMLSLLERVVRINSHTPNKAGSDAVGRIFAAELEALGFKMERAPHDSVGDTLLARSPACCSTSEGGRILFCGHMDTVFPESLGFDCFEAGTKEGSEIIRGPGVIDMKGGLVVALFALRELRRQGVLDRLPVTFVLNADEEVGSPHSTPVIAAEARKSAFALVFECAGLNGETVTARKGRRGMRLTCHGRAGHVGQAGRDKPSAILELARKIIALEGVNAPERGLTVNVGVVQGGMGPNSVPETAMAKVDCRFITIEDARFLEEACRGIMAEAVTPGVRSELVVENERPPMEASPGNRELFEMLRRIGEKGGIPVIEERRGGVSDANTIAGEGVPVLDGLGPSGDRDHSTDEYMLVRSLEQRVHLTVQGVLEGWERFGGR